MYTEEVLHKEQAEGHELEPELGGILEQGLVGN